MNAIEIEVTTRENHGKEATAKYRNAGKLPAILYGMGENSSLLLDKSIFIKSLKGSKRINPVLSLNGEGTKQKQIYAVVREVQKHPLSRDILHIDLQQVAEDKEVTVLVNVQYTGTPRGVKNEGGTLSIQRKRLRIQCLPKDIPEIIEVDIANIAAGEKIQVEGISAGDGVTFKDRPDTTIMTVKRPKGGTDRQDEPTEGEAAAATTKGAK